MIKKAAGLAACGGDTTGDENGNTSGGESSSLTKEERQNPDIIKASRRQRIAKGSGTSVQQVNQLLKQFEQSKEMMKQMKNGRFRPKF